jgi:hypothetical protein
MPEDSTMPFQWLLGGEIWSLALRTISGSSNHTAIDESAGTLSMTLGDSVLSSASDSVGKENPTR